VVVVDVPRRHAAGIQAERCIAVRALMLGVQQAKIDDQQRAV
jgi:hypothetical protein